MSRSNSNYSKGKQQGNISELCSAVFDNTKSGLINGYKYTTKKLADYVGLIYGGDMSYFIEHHKKRKVKYSNTSLGIINIIILPDGSKEEAKDYDYIETLICESN